jgi:hypothetical protein
MDYVKTVPTWANNTNTPQQAITIYFILREAATATADDDDMVHFVGSDH